MTHLKRLAIKPIRQTAITHLAVIEGAHPQNDVQTMFPAECNEFSQIVTTGKVKYAFILFDMIPKKISRYHIDAAHAHFDQFVLPALRIHAAEMKLTRNSQKGTMILFHVIVIERNSFPVWSCSLKVRSK